MTVDAYSRVRIKANGGPAAEPMTYAEAKLWLRVNHDLDTASITQLIRDARHEGEKFTGRAWINQTLILEVDAWPSDRVIHLMRPPVSSVTSVAYYDVDGVLQTVAATDYWFVGDDFDPIVRLKPTFTTPTLEDGRPAAIQVEYVAGYGAAATSVPGPYLSGFRMQLAHLHENRSPEVMGRIVSPLARGVEDLWSFERVVPIG